MDLYSRRMIYPGEMCWQELTLQLEGAMTNLDVAVWELGRDERDGVLGS